MSETLSNTDFEKIYLSRSKSREEESKNNVASNCITQSKTFKFIALGIPQNDEIKIHDKKTKRI